MFIKISALIRRMKLADKMGTLHIGADPDDTEYRGYYISGSWWTVHISTEEIPKDIKAEIVRYLGELPQGGHEYQLEKGYAQSCIYGAIDCFLPKWEVNAETQYRPTRYMLSSDRDVRIFQNPENLAITGMDSDALALLGDAVDQNGDSIIPRLTGRGTLIWSDTDTILELYPIDVSRTKFAEYMKGLDLIQEDETEPQFGKIKEEPPQANENVVLTKKEIKDAKLLEGKNKEEEETETGTEPPSD